jgi:hypothetical protein
MRWFVISVWVAAAAVAQTSSISGLITDPDGGVVKDAVVEAKNTANGSVVRGTTSARGEYALRVAAGTYDLAVPMPCCQWSSYSKSNLTVGAGQALHLDIRVQWGANLGTLGDDPILLLNDFRERSKVASGPMPRTRDGVPDLSGIWINVYNPDTPPPPLKPWAAQLLRERTRNGSKDYPGGYCLPANADSITRAFPYKFVQTPTLIVLIHESDTPGLRQIFLDGRSHPKDGQPTWQGHSIGHWEGDTLVVDTTGYNDKAWLSLSGIPHSEKLHTVERIRRLDFGHLEVEVTMEDPDTFSGPWKRTFAATLAPPQEEILEFICNENNRDANHYVNK